MSIGNKSTKVEKQDETEIKKQDESVVQVARISSKSAIIVALITIVGGAIAGYLLRPVENNRTTNQPHWIKIERIESSAPIIARLLIMVNGIKYSYPSSSVWQEIRDNTSGASERFLLPPGEESYKISFSAFLNSDEEVTSSNVQEVMANKLPSGVLSYDLYGVSLMTRSANPKNQAPIRVFYSLE